MSSVQLLDKTRKIGKLLHNNNSSKVVFNDICAVMQEILDSNVLVISKKGKVLGIDNTDHVEVIHELIKDKVGGFIDGWPERFYKVYIDFGCEPVREEELQAAVIETIKDVQSGNMSDEVITKLKESYTRNVETSMRNNYWWVNRISSEILFTYEPVWYTNNTGRVNEWITKEALIDAANKYLDTNKIVTAYLKPEGK